MHCVYRAPLRNKTECNSFLQKIKTEVTSMLCTGQSFVTTAHMGPGPGNSENIDFPLCKAQVYARHCGEFGWSSLVERRKKQKSNFMHRSIRIFPT